MTKSSVSTLALAALIGGAIYAGDPVHAEGSAGASSDMSTETTTTRTKQRPAHGSVRGNSDTDVNVGAHVQGGQPRNRASLPDGTRTNGKVTGSSTLN